VNATDTRHERRPDELRERLDNLAASGAVGIELARPATASPPLPRWRSPARLAIAAVGAVAVLAVVGTAVALVTGDDGTDDVSTRASVPEVGDPAPSWEGTPAAVVSVVYGDGGLLPSIDVDLRFVDSTGAEIARRNLEEITRNGGGGVLQAIPEGSQVLEVTFHEGGTDTTCTRPFDANIGEQIILRVEPPGREGSEHCAGREESVAEWAAGNSGPTGEAYLGLSRAQAEGRAADAGLTTRVVGLDGAHLVMTDDFRTDRLNLMVFADVVVAARLDGE
jgi:hypothetical protein